MGKTLPEFAKEISVLMPRLMREFLKRQASMITTCEVSFAQMAILHLLLDKPRCKMSDIARFLSVTTSAVTGIVDRMVRSGLLKRMPDAADRRVINIRITPKGRKAIEAIFKERRKMMTGIFAHFSPKEREAYLNSIKKVYAILTREKNEK